MTYNSLHNNENVLATDLTNYTELTIDDSSRPSHQRPPEVAGEWELVESSQRNIHQKIAAATDGWATLPNGVTLIGGEITRRGIGQSVEGLKHASAKEVAVGIGKIAIGRSLDLVDGYIAKKLGVRGKNGALLDATTDKALALYASFSFAKHDVISNSSAILIVGQQLAVSAENVFLEKIGGEPNPSKFGKFGMAAVWSTLGGRALQKAAQVFKAPKLETTTRQWSNVSETVALGLNSAAITGYASQLKTAVKKRKLSKSL